MRKKKIIHIVHNLQVGGVETAVRSSIDRLNENYNFCVITLHPSDHDFIKDLNFKHQIKCFNLHGILAPINLFRLIVFVVRLNPVLMLCSLWKSHGVASLINFIKPQIKIVPIIHSSKFFHKLDRFFTRQILKKSSLVLCDSNSSKIFVESLKIPSHIEVLSFKINDAELGLKSIKPFETGRFNAVFIGRLTAEKRIDRAIRLMSVLKEKGIDVTFDIYGPDHQTKHILISLANQLNLNISLHGSLSPDEVLYVLNQYNFFIQLSDVEGMAITVVQAMQQGLIPIVTAVGEMQFYVKHQQNGLVVNPPFDDLETIANQINELVKLPAKMKELSDAAQNTFVNQPLYADHLNQILKRQLEGK